MYYHCPVRSRKFKYALEDLGRCGEAFGTCPSCGLPGLYEKDGARTLDDKEYYEAEEE